VRNQLREQEEVAAAATVAAGDDQDEENDSDSNVSAWERVNGYRADTARFVPLIGMESAGSDTQYRRLSFTNQLKHT
jgi:hypothetical protein